MRKVVTEVTNGQRESARVVIVCVRGVRKFIAGLVALVLVLALVSWMAYVFYDALAPKTREVAEWTEEDEEEIRSVRMRRQVHLAQLPWTFDIDDPEEALVGGAGLPWVNRPLPGDGGAGPVTVAAMRLPAAFPRRQASDEPIEMALHESAIPWGGRKAGDVTVQISAAHVPAMKVKPNPDKPFEVKLAEPAVPWVRRRDEFGVVTITAAAVPPIKALEK